MINSALGRIALYVHIGTCFESGVIYEIECVASTANYIGDTKDASRAYEGASC